MATFNLHVYDFGFPGFSFSEPANAWEAFPHIILDIRAGDFYKYQIRKGPESGVIRTFSRLFCSIGSTSTTITIYSTADDQGVGATDFTYTGVNKPLVLLPYSTRYTFDGGIRYLFEETEDSFQGDKPEPGYACFSVSQGVDVQFWAVSYGPWG